MAAEEKKKEAMAQVYWNTMLMQKIIGDVEQFKDRNSLELASKRLRELSLKTAISRRNRYSIHIEQSTENFPAYTRIFHRRPHIILRFSVRTCSDVSKEDGYEIAQFKCRNDAVNEPQIFFTGVRSRLFKQIRELEIENRRFGNMTLDHIEQFPNLSHLMFRNSRGILPVPPADDDLFPDAAFVTNRVEGLTLVLDQMCSTELERLKRLIGPSLTHFRCVVNPCRSKDQWFIEELMVEMAINEVKLETCQLVFPDPKTPRLCVDSLTNFVSERCKVMQVSIFTPPEKVLSTLSVMIPSISIRFRVTQDEIVEPFLASCPTLFQKVKILEFSDVHEKHLDHVTDSLQKARNLEKLSIRITSQPTGDSSIDSVISALPFTLKSLSLSGCKMSQSSVDLLVSRCGGSLLDLSLSGNGLCNTVQNFTKVLSGLRNLKNLTWDMNVPHLLFAKIAEHSGLEYFAGNLERSPSAKSLLILQNRFDQVNIRKNGRVRQLLLSSSNKNC